jgi:hypothetical protein
MTRRKQPKNKTIVEAAVKRFIPKNQPVLDKYGRILVSEKKIKTIKKAAWEKIEGTDKMTKTVKEDGYTLTFIFPDDLDKIQPDSINGNLTIKFPQ